MINRARGILLITILGVSLAMNLAFLTYHIQAGTFRRLFVRLDMVEALTDHSAFQDSTEARYRKLPEALEGVVFAGDSLIYNGPWSEFYSNIHSRGIPNETSALLLGRLGDITRALPRRVILLTGANDLIQGVPIPQFLRNFRSILAKIRADSPRTDVAVIGLLPVDPSRADALRYDNASVLEANRQLEALTREFPGTRFLDLAPRLADESGGLRREFNEDGIHLTLEGYLAVRETIATLLDDSRSK
jgi:lysophospholipase L1-like esterase